MATKSKLLYLINDFQANSTNIILLEILTHLPAASYQATVVSFSQEGTLKKEFEKYAGVNVYDYDWVSTQWRLWQLLRNHQYTLITTQALQSEWRYYLARIFLPWTNQPFLITTRHNFFFQDRQVLSFVKNFLYFISCHLSSLNVCVAPHLKEKLHTQLKVPISKIAVIENGVPLPLLTPLTTRKITSTPRIIFVGQLIGRKQVMTFVQAVQEIKQQISCVIYGDGPLRSSVYQYLNRLELNQKIKLAGFQTDKRRMYRSGDIFVLPSTDEGYPLALLEAMSYGLPCIVSDIPPHLRLITNGINGLFFKTRNVKDLAKKITQLLRDKKLRQGLGRAARSTIQQNHQSIFMIKKYLQLYRQLISPQL